VESRTSSRASRWSTVQTAHTATPTPHVSVQSVATLTIHVQSAVPTMTRMHVVASVAAHPSTVEEVPAIVHSVMHRLFRELHSAVLVVPV
jgi:hypothetical protein